MFEIKHQCGLCPASTLIRSNDQEEVFAAIGKWDSDHATEVHPDEQYVPTDTTYPRGFQPFG